MVDWLRWTEVWTEMTLQLAGRSPDPLIHACTLAERLGQLFDAVAGHLLMCQIPDRPENLRILKHLRIGDWAPAERAAVNSYIADTNRIPDPFVVRYIQLGLHLERNYRSREELIPDEDWYSSEHYQKLRVRANQDACFYATMPAVSSNGVPVGDHVCWTFCLCRETGKPPFHPKEVAFASACFFGMSDLLHRVWLVPDSPADATLSELPLRLRRVASRLMAGDSVKEAAHALEISVHTASDYVKELYGRLGVTSRPELMRKLLAQEATRD